MNRHGTDIPEDTIAAFCRRNHIRRLALFGSVLHGEARPDSDIDLHLLDAARQVPGFAVGRVNDDLDHDRKGS